MRRLGWVGVAEAGAGCAPHEGVVALRVLARQPNVLVCSSRVDQCDAIESGYSTRLEGDAFDAPTLTVATFWNDSEPSLTYSICD